MNLKTSWLYATVHILFNIYNSFTKTNAVKKIPQIVYAKKWRLTLITFTRLAFNWISYSTLWNMKVLNYISICKNDIFVQCKQLLKSVPIHQQTLRYLLSTKREFGERSHSKWVNIIEFYVCNGYSKHSWNCNKFDIYIDFYQK